MWIDALMITFSCVMFIHMGLKDAMMNVLHVKRDFKIVSCPRCLTFWCVLATCLVRTGLDVTLSSFVSFTCAYVAVWFDLILTLLDERYEKIYGDEEASEDSPIHDEDDPDERNKKGKRLSDLQ